MCNWIFPFSSKLKKGLGNFFVLEHNGCQSVIPKIDIFNIDLRIEGVEDGCTVPIPFIVIDNSAIIPVFRGKDLRYDSVTVSVSFWHEENESQYDFDPDEYINIQEIISDFKKQEPFDEALAEVCD